MCFANAARGTVCKWHTFSADRVGRRDHHTPPPGRCNFDALVLAAGLLTITIRCYISPIYVIIMQFTALQKGMIHYDKRKDHYHRDHAFLSCPSLQKVTIPASTTLNVDVPIFGGTNDLIPSNPYSYRKSKTTPKDRPLPTS